MVATCPVGHTRLSDVTHTRPVRRTWRFLQRLRQRQRQAKALAIARAEARIQVFVYKFRARKKQEAADTVLALLRATYDAGKVKLTMKRVLYRLKKLQVRVDMSTRFARTPFSVSLLDCVCRDNRASCLTKPSFHTLVLLPAL